METLIQYKYIYLNDLKKSKKNRSKTFHNYLIGNWYLVMADSHRGDDKVEAVLRC